MGGKISQKRDHYKIQGDVRLILSVNEKGKVTDVSVVGGQQELAEAAVQAARKWKYVPYYRDGKPVSANTAMTLQFKIDNAGKPEIDAMYEPRHSGPVLKTGTSVKPPKAIYSPDPPYSAEALKEKFAGTCVLSLIVGADGRAHNIRVTRALGKGLDEEAIETVKQWRFEPAMKDGEPVAVYATIEVAFHL